MFTTIAIIIALFFAMNIGASGAAATMGVAYGSGAIKSKRKALLICSLFILLGSYFGTEVVKTIGNGIIPEDIASVKIAVIILLAATSTLFFANLMGIPLSTSEVTVGAVVGVGVAYQALYISSILEIVFFWVFVPVFSFFITYIIRKWVMTQKRREKFKKKQGREKYLVFFLLIAGCFEAFSAGMNNVANAVGPLVGAGVISASFGVIVGGAFIALGALLLGGRVLETNGKKITALSKGEGIMISLTGGGLVFVASLFGLPIPLTQVTTSSIIGVGTAKQGAGIWQKSIVFQMVKVWVVSPIFSLMISYGLVKLTIQDDWYSFFVIIICCLATLGTVSLAQNSSKKKLKVTSVERTTL
ncbi:inorganic phosphate transporter [Priestia filamentosa]|uniref:inorganic phosphate transporter n=1 Tax=Priestia filamentosa TaxID=1402861 RepID=UPI003982B393